MNRNARRRDPNKVLEVMGRMAHQRDAEKSPACLSSPAFSVFNTANTSVDDGHKVGKVNVFFHSSDSIISPKEEKHEKRDYISQYPVSPQKNASVPVKSYISPDKCVVRSIEKSPSKVAQLIQKIEHSPMKKETGFETSKASPSLSPKDKSSLKNMSDSLNSSMKELENDAESISESSSDDENVENSVNSVQSSPKDEIKDLKKFKINKPSPLKKKLFKKVFPGSLHTPRPKSLSLPQTPNDSEVRARRKSEVAVKAKFSPFSRGPKSSYHGQDFPFPLQREKLDGFSPSKYSASILEKYLNDVLVESPGLPVTVYGKLKEGRSTHLSYDIETMALSWVGRTKLKKNKEERVLISSLVRVAKEGNLITLYTEKASSAAGKNIQSTRFETHREEEAEILHKVLNMLIARVAQIEDPLKRSDHLIKPPLPSSNISPRYSKVYKAEGSNANKVDQGSNPPLPYQHRG